MRLSSNPLDEDFRPDLVRRAKIRFNGYEVDRIIVADEERGFIVQAMVDDHGRPIVRGGEIASTKRYGGVVIEITDDDPKLFAYRGPQCTYDGPIDAPLDRRCEKLFGNFDRFSGLEFPSIKDRF